ncbi:DEAD-box ATP-dependent RNA helicase 38 [Tanacetum coccineum]|uniref:ATP-dependent RNA helicase n=1 Tax=Tanacetum coccineum TaxID=301880 RepID=A0ABQ5IAK1_9ASTR
MALIRPYESNYYLDSDNDPSIIPVIVDEYEHNLPYAESYNDFSFSKTTRKAVLDILKYKRPNRMHAIALRMMNYFPYRNVLAQARFSSKMYECYVLTIINRISMQYGLQVILICPTFELASEIEEQVLKIGKFTGIRSRVVGVADSSPDSNFYFECVSIGTPHIIIGTPNAIWRLISTKKLDLSNIKMVVVEKADQIVELSMGDDTLAVMHAVDPKCQLLLFYGTITDKLKEFVEKRLDKRKWDRLFVNLEEFCISRLKMFHVVLPDEEKKAAAIKEIVGEIPRDIHVILYVNPETDLRYLREALLGFDVAYVPELVDSKERTKDVGIFKDGLGAVLVTCVPPTTGFDESKVNLLIFHDIPVIRGHPDYECYYSLTAQVGRNTYEDEWNDEIGRNAGYCVLHTLTEKDDVLMTKIQDHFGRSILKITDEMAGFVSKGVRALELGSLVLEISTYKSEI